MKWEYFGTGLAFIGIGVTLMLALPPPWWPKMPPALVHIGVMVGIALTVVGVILAIYGFWTALPSPRLAVLGMGVSVLLFGVFAAWFWIIPEKTFTVDEIKPLKRMIAYGRLDLVVPWNGIAPQFHGYNVGVKNVSDDTITARLMYLNADVDGTQIMASSASSSPVIVPQTQGTIFQARRTPENDMSISMDAKPITAEFEVDYDTIPESGVRRSYRKIAYTLNWANGKNSSPLLEPQTVDEWER